MKLFRAHDTGAQICAPVLATGVDPNVLLGRRLSRDLQFQEREAASDQAANTVAVPVASSSKAVEMSRMLITPIRL